MEDSSRYLLSFSVGTLIGIALSYIWGIDVLIPSIIGAFVGTTIDIFFNSYS